MREETLRRFYKFVFKQNSTPFCWIWTGQKTYDGYGGLKVFSHQRLAHRVSYEHFKGSTEGKDVLHKCDNPSCVNPDHLFLGNQKINTLDSMNKGRFRPWGRRTPGLTIEQKEHLCKAT